MKHPLVLYTLLIGLLMVFSYGFIDGNFFHLHSLYTGIFIQHREFSAIFYFIFVVILFLWYLYFLNSIQKEQIGHNEFKKIIIITIGLLLFSYPAMLSFDVFNYTTTSKVLFFYKENPYITMPLEFSNDTFLQYTRASNKVALYGPLWIILTGIPYLFSLVSFLSSLIAMKVLVISCYLGIGYVIWKFTKKLYAVALFLLNPLVIIETLISSHNDSVMMFLVLASFYLFYKKRIFCGIALFIASVLIKYATIALLPVVIFLIWKHVKKENIQWNTIFLTSLLLMVGIFFTAPIREEIYPWYWIWVLPFVSLLYKNNFIKQISIVFSFALLLGYIPVLYTGNYFGTTPLIKILITIAPIIIYVSFVLKKKIYHFFS